MGGSSPQTVHSTTKVTPMKCWWVVEVTFLCGMVLLNLLYSSVAVIGSTSPIMDMVQDLGLKLQCTKHTWHYKIRQHFSGHSVQKFLRVMSVIALKKNGASFKAGFACLVLVRCCASKAVFQHNTTDGRYCEEGGGRDGDRTCYTRRTGRLNLWWIYYGSLVDR